MTLPSPTPNDAPLLLSAEEQACLLESVNREVLNYLQNVEKLPTSELFDPAEVRTYVEKIDFDQPTTPTDCVEYIAHSLGQYQVHTPHARYFGLFNPAASTMGIAADALGAAFNCQLAAWSHSPFANEAERHLLLAFAEKFGMPVERCDGTFTSGGAEANHTALLCALAARFPTWRETGARGLSGLPIVYVSAEAHHSFLKAARACGLGEASVRSIATDESLRMRPDLLQSQIEKDLMDGHIPCFVAATAGTTNAGAIDPLPEIHDTAQRFGLWFHVDAAWGGAVALLPEWAHLLSGIGAADSVTFDAHKWLSVPMGCGMVITSHPRELAQAFGTATAYMPAANDDAPVYDPFSHSLQWSRRFIGLKLLMTLMTAGWEGYRKTLRTQWAMGDLLRQRLSENGWRLVNDTPLPISCFVDNRHPDGATDAYLREIVQKVTGSGAAWISITQLSGIGPALRACVTSFRTRESDVDALIAALEKARDSISAYSR